MKFFVYNPLLKTASLNIKVKAAAKSNDIKEFIIINDVLHLKLSIKAHAQQGKANEEIINFLAKEWQLLRSNLEITKGHTNSLKTILIKNIDEEYLNLILKPYIK
ncbi:hypothetical protein A3306_05775 [Rickettsia bellii]|uniref:UPF0235 protein RBE_0633 n=4 Tax=Rickettsia bellii TaxID=33990 RepID=Y633_RICBR|nr:DUF167 domain-containing protein [Rickettsia bellii]A8GWJ3.1 RecName: Full=UPF0235 protein A1I_04385 [Rickettsia bellii OSU 85-389]Q1RIV0.1 RecName: Full=UPF0235 protein RBE_0633 [Rickettsia bellii RML369-C]ABE04714.1 unknown [Rickettsia bellii RML369-C]ABV79220.1 hypothetical protein A1I_04385 [Rickettsia bellii OSU 85-389]ARD86652.1 hypothetical protein A3306_05775 [Rickettsia bellii]KJV89684.1 hypothetical protein RBEAN4_0665 [Rickettsia bellii str. RML An4]KJV91923.1 hypothetical prot